jgi:hypothetical protein
MLNVRAPSVPNTPWRSELTSVEKLGDDLCGGLKVSSNVFVIAIECDSHVCTYLKVKNTYNKGQNLKKRFLIY